MGGIFAGAYIFFKDGFFLRRSCEKTVCPLEFGERHFLLEIKEATLDFVRARVGRRMNRNKRRFLVRVSWCHDGSTTGIGLLRNRRTHD